MGGLPNNIPNTKTTTRNYIQTVGNGQASVPDLSIWPHIAVTEAKWEQIKANLSEPPLGNCNNQEAEAVDVLLESESKTIEDRGINIVQLQKSSQTD